MLVVGVFLPRTAGYSLDCGIGRTAADAQSARMRKLDGNALRESFASDSKRSGFYEPSFSNRGTRQLKTNSKRYPLWPKVAIALVLICAALMLWVRFGAR